MNKRSKAAASFGTATKLGWSISSIGEECTVVNGGTPKTGVSAYWDGEIRWITPAEMGKRDTPFIAETRRTITQEGVRDSSATLLPPYSVILSSRAPIGHLVINTEVMATNQGCKGLVPKKRISYKYVYYYLLSIVDLLNSLGSGTTFKELSGEKLKEVPIPVAPMSEQVRIVAILDEAFEGIDRAKANTERSLIGSQALFDALLANTYSGRGSHWRTETISNVSKHNLGKMLDKVKNRGTLRPYLRNLNVRWFEFDLSDMKEMPFLPEESARYSIAKGDVVICEGGYPGRAAIWDGDDSIHFQKALHRVRFTNPLHSKWFVYYLYSQHRLGLLKPWFTGTGISHFTAEALARFELPVPPDNELKVIVQQFDDVRQMALDLEKLYRQKLVTIEELRQSLLERAFSGNL